MRRILVLGVIALLFAPFLLQAAGGIYFGYNVSNGVRNLVPTLTGRYLVYQQPVERQETYPRTDYRTVTWRGELESEALREASGLAVSPQNDTLFYSINDSGNEPVLFALDDRGSHTGSWSLAYDGFHDFEDLASFSLDGRAYILVADTGDNFRWRNDLKLLVFPEPDATLTEVALEAAWIIPFTYPEGYRDCEAVAVDEAAGEILLVSKGHVPAEVFRLPLQPKTSAIQVAEPIARLDQLPQPTLRDLREDPVWGDYRSTPTALDLRGNQVVIVTYRDAYLYSRAPGRDWAETFRSRPARVALPKIDGLESGALTRSGQQLLLVGERPEGIDRMGVYLVDLAPAPDQG